MDHIAKITAQLPEHGLDAMLVTSAPGERYAVGFEGEGWVLVSRDGARYSTDGRYIEAARQQVTGAEIVLTERGQSHLALAREEIRRRGLKRVGFESGRVSADELGRWKDSLPCELVAAQGLLDGLRAAKDEEELARMRQAQRITDGSMPHAVPGETVIQPGMFVTMDFGCVYEGYCSDMTRTVAVGQPTDEMERVYHTVLEAQRAGIAAARAGVTGSEVDRAARQAIQQAGYGSFFSHSFGHSLGLEIHESPNASPSEQTVFPAGAVISAEPGIYLPGHFGVRIEDVLVLREGGCEDITQAPKNLIVL